jgi:predicted amidophosphoribosyltransferase
MGTVLTIVIFLVLAVASAAAIAYPLLPGRTPAPATPALTEAEIERAVRELRRSRQARVPQAGGRQAGGGGPACPTCGAAYQPGDTFCARCGGKLGAHACPACGAAYRPGDLFCVRCGGSLPQEEAQPEPEEPACSNCGAALHAGDRFCAKCGRPVATEEGA